MQIKCDNYNCDNNTITHECMFGINDKLIQYAKTEKPMCEILRRKVLEHVNKTKDNLDT